MKSTIFGTKHNNIWDQIFEDYVIAWRKNPVIEFEFDPKKEKNDYLKALCLKQSGKGGEDERGNY